MEQEFELRTDMDCHACSKIFVAELDLTITGNHVIECPHCGHEHCRVIHAGKVTGIRWDSRYEGAANKPLRVWKHNVLQMQTTAATMFIQERWRKTLSR